MRRFVGATLAVPATLLLQMLVLALAYDSYKGKMGIGKLLAGSLSRRPKALVQMPRDYGPLHSNPPEQE